MQHQGLGADRNDEPGEHRQHEQHDIGERRLADDAPDPMA